MAFEISVKILKSTKVTSPGARPATASQDSSVSVPCEGILSILKAWVFHSMESTAVPLVRTKEEPTKPGFSIVACDPQIGALFLNQRTLK